VNCLLDQLTPAEAQAALAAGTSLPEFGAVFVVIYLFADGLLLLTASALIWRKPTDLAAAFGAFALVAAVTGTLVQAAARSMPAFLLPAQMIEFVQISSLVPFFGLIQHNRFHPGWLRWAALAIVPIAAVLAFDLAGAAVSGILAVALGVGIGVVIASSVFMLYRSPAGSAQQEQAAWTVAAVILLAGAQLIGRPVRLLPLPPIPLDAVPVGFFNFFPFVGMLLVVAALTCLAVAFLSEELFRVEVALNRAIVYGLLSLFVVGGYVLVVGYLSLVFRSSDNIWFSLVATGAVAALFHPIRGRLQRFINRMIYGERDDPYTVLAQLGRRLETAMASDTVIPTILQTVREALKVSYAALVLQGPGGEELNVAYETGQPGRILLDLPLVYHSEIIGRFRLGPRFGGEPFSQVDRLLLDDLVRQAGAAIHAAKQNADLQMARQRLVTAREEERRRVRRDLHDGLGASLAALNLQAGELQRLIIRDPDEAACQVAALREAIRAAIADIRRLVYGLRPPALDELGLIEALRARPAQASSVSVLVAGEPQAGSPAALRVKLEAPEELAPLPAAVEAAAHRITIEALTNTIQHARAGQCTIRLIPAEGGLSVEVCDDGAGMPEEYQFGVGLISMRERCSELGGSLLIDSAPGRGTRIRAWLPLASGRPEGSNAPG